VTARGGAIVARKELMDHFRDTGSLVSGALYALMGPAVVLLVSFSRVANEGSSPDRLLGVMSVFTLVSAFTGGLNIAMDATSGERERRSLLPLLLTPVPPRDVVVGKWLAASACALAAVAINLAGLTIVLGIRAPATLYAHAVTLVLWALLGLVPLALLGAAIAIVVAMACRTMKQAQTWLSLVVFVPMLVGMYLVFFPVPADSWWIALPVVGQQIALESGMHGSPASLLHLAGLAAATLVSLAGPLFGAERLLARETL
jgi:sodium transport system permease protein